MVKIVRYTAEWCGPCKMMNPVFDQLKQELNNEVEIESIDVDQNPQEAKMMGITSIPTIIFYKNGIAYDKQIGAAPKSIILSKIKRGS